MLEAIVRDSNQKELYKFQIPENQHHLKYSMYIEYSCYTSEIFDWVKEKQEKGEDYFYEYQILIAKAVCKIFSTPDNIIDYDVIKNLKYKKQDWLWTAWSLIERIIGEYEPEQNGGVFRHNDKTYRIPQITKSIITGEVYSQDLTFQQTAEIADIERKLIYSTKKIETVENITIRGTNFEKVEALAAATYTATIQKIALVLAEPNEIPTDSSFMKWLDDRCVEIQDINMVNALNTIFFLTNTSDQSGVLIELSHILNRLNLGNLRTRKGLTTAQE